MPGIAWAKDLIPALKASGTGDGKLEAIRRAMLARHADERYAHLPAAHPDRHLTAAGAVAALRAVGAGEVTVRKALELANTGTFTPPKPEAHPADLIPAPETPVDYVPPPVEDVEEEPDPLPAVAGVTDLTENAIGPSPLNPQPKRTRAKVG